MSRSGVIGDIACNHSLRLMYIHENDGQQVASKCPNCLGYDFRKLVCNRCGHTCTDTGTCKCFAEINYNPTHPSVRKFCSGQAIEITQDNGADHSAAPQQ